MNKKLKPVRWLVIPLVVLLLITVLAATVLAQAVVPAGDFGDAPESDLNTGVIAIAYPSTNTPGQFPTCLDVGPVGSFVYHAPTGLTFFGPTIDYELDGNAGGYAGDCGFPPYDLDECCIYSPMPSAGLLFPGPYTIDMSYTVVPCPGCQGSPLGQTCQWAQWGANVDISVNNTSGPVSYVNVLMDWNQDGMWGGSSVCPDGSSAPEHVLVNFVVPNGYCGPLSGRTPPSFKIGPNAGYVWTRFTISAVTDQPLPTEWDGSGFFQQGETEDYLLKVNPPSPPQPPVGITVIPIDKAGLLLPWLGLAGLLVLATGVVLFARRRLNR